MEMRELLSICTPRAWTPLQGTDVQLQELQVGSEEYFSVVSKIRKTLDVTITSVQQVQNPFLWGCYQLKKLEYQAKNVSVREVEVFHCTSVKNVLSIVRDNLDWRKSKRCKYGQGVSFSPSAQYANKYANINIGYQRALILTKILVGHEVQGNKYMTIPPINYDTSFGNRNSDETLVYVKYYDFEFYPSYVAYYTC